MFCQLSNNTWCQQSLLIPKYCLPDCVALSAYAWSETKILITGVTPALPCSCCQLSVCDCRRCNLTFDVNKLCVYCASLFLSLLCFILSIKMSRHELFIICFKIKQPAYYHWCNNLCLFICCWLTFNLRFFVLTLFYVCPIFKTTSPCLLFIDASVVRDSWKLCPRQIHIHPVTPMTLWIYQLVSVSLWDSLTVKCIPLENLSFSWYYANV